MYTFFDDRGVVKKTWVVSTEIHICIQLVIRLCTAMIFKLGYLCYTLVCSHFLSQFSNDNDILCFFWCFRFFSSREILRSSRKRRQSVSLLLPDVSRSLFLRFLISPFVLSFLSACLLRKLTPACFRHRPFYVILPIIMPCYRIWLLTSTSLIALETGMLAFLFSSFLLTSLFTSVSVVVSFLHFRWISEEISIADLS